MGIPYRPLMLGAILAAATALSCGTQPSSTITSQPNQTPTGIEFKMSSEPIRKFHQFYLPDPVRVDPQNIHNCLGIELGDISEKFDAFPFMTEGFLDKFIVIPKELGEKYQDNITEAAMRCKYDY